jgi:phosphatidylinositol-3-phosphatase
MSSGGSYFARHVPFLYYTDISQASCQANVVDYSNLAADLKSASMANYVFITPNGCNDMHDCSVQTGDAWLAQNVPAILTAAAFTQQHSLLLIVWDEDDYSGSNQVALIAVGYKVKVGFTSSVSYNHYSLLKTVDAAWSLATLTGNDQAASAMTDLISG